MKSGKPEGTALRIVCIAEEPIEQVPYIAAAPGSKGISYEWLPIYWGEMLGLPDGVEALIVTSDLQGIAGHEFHGGRDNRLVGEELPETLDLLLRCSLPDVNPARVIVLLCGDLYADPFKRGSSGDPLPAWKAFHRHFGTVVGVAGNHDLFTGEGIAELEAAQGIDFYSEPKLAVHGGMIVAGLGGVTGRAGKPNRMPEADYLGFLQKLLRKGPHVLMLHQGPDVPAAGFPGHAGTREALEAAPPLLVCCGHVHWEQSLAELENGTQVLNVDGRVLVFTEASLD